MCKMYTHNTVEELTDLPKQDVTVSDTSELGSKKKMGKSFQKEKGFQRAFQRQQITWTKTWRHRAAGNVQGRWPALGKDGSGRKRARKVDWDSYTEKSKQLIA